MIPLSLQKKAFAAELSATFVILLATKLGIPISTTHASCGAVIGCGIAEAGFKKGVDWNMLYKIFAGWVLTIPLVGLLFAGIFAFALPIFVPTPIMN